MLPREAQNSQTTRVQANASTSSNVDLSKKYSISNNEEVISKEKEKEWTEDSSSRQKLLLERKKKMILEARK